MTKIRKIKCDNCSGDGRVIDKRVIVTCPVCRGQGEYDQ